MTWLSSSVLHGLIIVFISLLLAKSYLCSKDFLSEQHLVYSITSKIGANNFTYFKLHKNGKIKIILNSIEGDADLYVSSSTLFPTYKNYELKSATCGEDIADVPSDMERPIGIGVFGHPFIDTTTFELQVFTYDEGNNEDEDGFTFNVEEGGKKESLLWNILISILKIIVDVLV